MKVSKHHFQEHKYLFVLFFLVNFLLTPIHLLILSSMPALVVVNFSLVILAGISICTEKKFKFIYYVTAFITLFFIWMEYIIVRNFSLHIARFIASFCSFSFLCFIMIKDLVKSKFFDLQSILDAVVGYLFIGFIGGIIFEFLDTALPGSFTHGEEIGGYIYYFSFISITTVGYGYISPITPRTIHHPNYKYNWTILSGDSSSTICWKIFK
ncbi:MAG: hypothetical protein JKY48_08975 [Flavobacteriales bacterium]|nr:hypothetical protein [Flavobacteriales bacterium]